MERGAKIVVSVNQEISAKENWQLWLSALEEPIARHKLRVALLVTTIATPCLVLVVLKHVCVMKGTSLDWSGQIIVTFVV